MLILLKNIGYLILIIGINLFVISFLNNKIVSRMELRRGYKGYKRENVFFPFVKSLKFISKENPFSFWDILIFIFTMIFCCIIPISLNISIIDSSYSVLMAITVLILIIIFKIFSVSYSKYDFIISDFIKKINQIVSYIIPLLFCILSIIILNKSFDFKVIVNSQYQYWNIIYQPIGFVIFFISILLQMKLLNFSESNQFLLSGNINKEGEGISKLIARLTNYLIIFFQIIMLNILYLGGWQKFHLINGNIMSGLKFYIILLLLMILEKSISGISNFKKLINLNYKLILPLSVVNLIITIIFFVLRNVYSII